MRSGNASGFQIVFLSFAALLLAVPLSTFLGNWYGSTNAEKEFIGRIVPFLAGAVLFLSIPALRRGVIAFLSTPIPRERRAEVALVAVAKIPLALAAIGSLALWYWMTQGNAVLEQHMLAGASRDDQLAFAFSPTGLMLFFPLGAIIVPVMEELLFRGFLYRAWERRWGWFPSMLLVSTLFGLYHPHFFAAFASSVVFVCVLRRTGSLWAPIVVHSFSNAMLWYPFAGQLLVPAEGKALGDIASWGMQLTCLLLATLALPTYVWMAREEYRPDAEEYPPDAFAGAR